MSEDVYVLKQEINDDALSELNDDFIFVNERLFNAMKRCRTASLDKIEDWILAIKSGKKIVNPLSPKEELKEMLEDEESEPEDRLWYDGWKKGIIEAVKVIAKEHPDVADWLKDSETE